MPAPDKPSDLLLASVAGDTYDPTARWDESWTQDDIHVGMRRAGRWALIGFRGSEDQHDWREDFKAWPKKHPQLGYVHAGFADGMDGVLHETLPWIEEGVDIAVTGHSLGAARALIYAGLLIAAGHNPRIVVTFGTPRPGFAQLSNMILGSGAEGRHYRNGSDPVADVPFAVPLVWPYQVPFKDVWLCVAPPEVRDPFAWHHWPLYNEGVRQRAIAPPV